MMTMMMPDKVVTNMDGTLYTNKFQYMDTLLQDLHEKYAKKHRLH
jgi:hypothetical protein